VNNAKSVVVHNPEVKSLYHIAAAVYAIAAGRAWAQAPQIRDSRVAFRGQIEDGSICFRQRWETALHLPLKVTGRRMRILFNVTAQSGITVI
jgi:hypothetical protein